jgi:hypothetical protein
MISYKKIKSKDERIRESNAIMARNSCYIPVIVETEDKELAKKLLKRKFLVPHDATVSHLLFSIRKQIKVDCTKAIFIFCNNVLLSGSKSVGEIYEEFQKNNLDSEDRFLYIQIQQENTFG